MKKKQTKNKSAKTASKHFTLGSSMSDVLRVMGTPSSYSRTLFHYGFATVKFEDGEHVTGWDNFDGSLNVKLLPPGPAKESGPNPARHRQTEIRLKQDSDCK
jgi:hypothetical protein